MDLQKLTDAELNQLMIDTEKSVSRYNNLQQAQKILLNGGYGAMSNDNNRWYSDDIAESITLSGQLSARWIIEHVNAKFNSLYKTDNVDYVIACDTDSIHLNVQPAVDKAFPGETPTNEQKLAFLENFSQIISEWIKEGYDLLAKELNVFESAMHMKLETISRAVWTGKKHYVMEVRFNEGIRYDPPKMKIVGLEAVKSSTPKIVREWMTELFPLILDCNKKQIEQILADKWELYQTLPFESIASPRSVSDLEKYQDPVTVFGAGCPIAVRGALLYNYILFKDKLTDQLPLIQSGDKVRFCYMKLPNPFNQNVLAAPDTLPAQLQLEPYIDHRVQYDKTFADPIKAVIEAAGMRLTNEIDIEEFFF
jgi:DNA polymerase family B